MLLIVGLGNPGAEHARNRHNVGFMAVDAIHRRHGFPAWRRRFHGEIAEGTLGGEKTLLLKPLTFMNQSGRAVGEAAHFYKIKPADILVIHDEVDLAPGKTRMKSGGGSAGHNGLRSISGHIGDGYRRLRIGIGHPGMKEMVHIHVLHDFAKSDAEWLDPLLDAIAKETPLVVAGKDSTFANRLHKALTSEEPAKAKEKPRPDKDMDAPAESKSQIDSGLPKPPKPRPDKPDGPLARGLKRLFGSRE
jgi:PTH1 family peptidyl-tRNA hydrolase